LLNRLIIFLLLFILFNHACQPLSTPLACAGACDSFLKVLLLGQFVCLLSKMVVWTDVLTTWRRLVDWRSLKPLNPMFCSAIMLRLLYLVGLVSLRGLLIQVSVVSLGHPLPPACNLPRRIIRTVASLLLCRGRFYLIDELRFLILVGIQILPGFAQN